MLEGKKVDREENANLFVKKKKGEMGINGFYCLYVHQMPPDLSF